jgi:hypothetical protein
MLLFYGRPRDAAPFRRESGGKKRKILRTQSSKRGDYGTKTNGWRLCLQGCTRVGSSLGIQLATRTANPPKMGYLSTQMHLIYTYLNISGAKSTITEHSLLLFIYGPGLKGSNK